MLEAKRLDARSLTVTVKISSKPWTLTPNELGAALEQGHGLTHIMFSGDMEGSGAGSYVVTYYLGQGGKREHFSYSELTSSSVCSGSSKTDGAEIKR